MYVPLYQAALNGDWEKAKEFIRLHPSALSARIARGRKQFFTLQLEPDRPSLWKS
ncbi:hypothetical protein CsSME_00029813 [Camellia sinensis var. sinensis]